MIELSVWLPVYEKALKDCFGQRVCFVGLQGSYARGEATENSDLDLVVILDELTPADIRAYSRMLDTLPHREVLCGFLSGKKELQAWDAGDLFQFYHDTKPIMGRLEDIIALPGAQAAKQAVSIGACNLYHGCVHNLIYGKKERTLAGLYKSAAFLIQAVQYLRTGDYIRDREELMTAVPADEKEILQTTAHLKNGGEMRFDEMSDKLFTWVQKLIAEQ